MRDQIYFGLLLGLFLRPAILATHARNFFSPLWTEFFSTRLTAFQATQASQRNGCRILFWFRIICHGRSLTRTEICLKAENIRFIRTATGVWCIWPKTRRIRRAREWSGGKNRSWIGVKSRSRWRILNNGSRRQP